MKTIYITADYLTTLTRAVEVEDDFDPTTANFEDLFVKDAKSYDPVDDAEKENIMQNLGDAEIWLARDSDGNEIWCD